MHNNRKKVLDDAGDVCIFLGMDNEFRSMKPSERKELVQIWLGDDGWSDPVKKHIKWSATNQGITSWNAYAPSSAGAHVAWNDLDWVDGSLVIISTGKRFKSQ